MKQLLFEKDTPQGKVKGVLRVIGKYLFFKFNNNQYSQQIIQQMSHKGALITQGNGWLRIDIIKQNKLVKLGELFINLELDSEEEVENKLFQFYTQKYAQGGFKLS